jgi:hypothetical protein
MDINGDGHSGVAADSFSEWLKKLAPPEVKRWGDQLTKLGVSWHSFRDYSPEELVKDLVASDIPLMASRDIVALVKKELAQKDAPMAILWDLVNVPIPSDQSGRDISMRIKHLVAPYGRLVQFRGYGRIASGIIPGDNRSDLHLGGCDLVENSQKVRVRSLVQIMKALKQINSVRSSLLCYTMIGGH